MIANYRDVATGQSCLQRLDDLDDYAALVAQGPLGFLLTSGTLDRYLKTRRDAQTRARQGQEVLELFQQAGK